MMDTDNCTLLHVRTLWFVSAFSIIDNVPKVYFQRYTANVIKKTNSRTHMRTRMRAHTGTKRKCKNWRMRNSALPERCTLHTCVFTQLVVTSSWFPPNIQRQNSTKRWTHTRTRRRTYGTQVRMGCNRDLLSEKTRGMFHYLTERPPSIPFYGKQRPSRSRVPHKRWG